MRREDAAREKELGREDTLPGIPNAFTPEEHAFFDAPVASDTGIFALPIATAEWIIPLVAVVMLVGATLALLA